MNWQAWFRSPYAKAAMVLMPISIFGGFGYRLYVYYLDLEYSYLDAVEFQIMQEAGLSESSVKAFRSRRVVPKALTRYQRLALEKERDRIIGQLARLSAVQKKRDDDSEALEVANSGSSNGTRQ